MKIPEKAPNIKDIIDKNQGKLFLQELNEIVNKLMDSYDYWSKFKYKPLPENVTPELAWARRELESLATRQELPFTDKSGKPFSFCLPPRTQPVLHFIDRDAPSFPITDMRDEGEKNKYLLASIMEEAIASSKIEGAATTRRIAKEMLASNTRPKDKSQWMIYNNYQAMNKIKERYLNESLSESMLLDLHKTLTENTLPKEEEETCGRFRVPQKDDDINVYDADGSLLYRPSLAKDIPAEISKLIDFANKKHDGFEDSFIHPVIKAVILHFWIAYIHPFVDGNGRTARALFYWFMLKNGYWIFEYISISKLVLKMRREYMEAFLYSEVSDNDVTYFIMFNLDIIEKSIKDVVDLINKKEAQQKKSRIIFDKYPDLNFRQRDILINAIKNPDREYKIAMHQGLHKISYRTARADFVALARKGLMEKRQVGKTFIFIPVRDLQKKLYG